MLSEWRKKKGLKKKKMVQAFQDHQTYKNESKILLRIVVQNAFHFH